MDPGPGQEELLLALAPPGPPAPDAPPPAAGRRTAAFLMCAIQESAALWERHPKAMRAAYARYINLLGAAVSAHRGSAPTIVDASAYATFATVADAIAAAVEVCHAVRAAAWEKIGALPSAWRSTPGRSTSSTTARAARFSTG